MATQEQHKQLLEQVNERLDRILSFKIEELTRENELGSQLSFKDIEDLYIKIIELFKKVKEVDLTHVPYSLLNNFNGHLNNALTQFEKAINFQPNTNNPVAVRDGIINNIRNQYDGYYTHSLPILTTGLLISNDLSVEKAKLNKLIEEFQLQNNQVTEESQAKLAELNDTLEKAQSAAAQVGVSNHAVVFKSESEEHQKQASFWFKCTIGILIGIMFSAIGLAFVGQYFVTNNAEVLQFTITKIIVLSAMFYGLALTNRNYKAHKHNSILNKHRQNALTTFETFSKAAGSDLQTKNAVLIETTHSIFSNQQTGYMKNDNESDSQNKIIEIVKGVASKGE